jgi:hypothetical protein
VMGSATIKAEHKLVKGKRSLPPTLRRMTAMG